MGITFSLSPAKLLLSMVCCMAVFFDNAMTDVISPFTKLFFYGEIVQLNIQKLMLNVSGPYIYLIEAFCRISLMKNLKTSFESQLVSAENIALQLFEIILILLQPFSRARWYAWKATREVSVTRKHISGIRFECRSGVTFQQSV